MSRAVAWVGGFARVDLRRIARDRFLYGMLGFVFAIAFALRFGVPPMTDWLLETQGFDLRPFYPLLSGQASLLIGGMLAGTVGGFMLLEQREDGTLRAQMVTPASLDVYLGYRVLAPVVVAFVLIPPTAWIIDLTLPPPWALIPLAAAASLFAGIVTLFLATFAQNKMQAFAISKSISASGMIVIAAWFVDEPWEFLAGIFPPYWVQKAFWDVGSGARFWLWLALGVVGQLLMLWLFARRFRAIAYR